MTLQIISSQPSTIPQPMVAAKASFPLSRLPPEIRMYIFQRLCCKELFTAAVTCRYMRSIAIPLFKQRALSGASQAYQWILATNLDNLPELSKNPLMRSKFEIMNMINSPEENMTSMYACIFRIQVYIWDLLTTRALAFDTLNHWYTEGIAKHIPSHPLSKKENPRFWRGAQLIVDTQDVINNALPQNRTRLLLQIAVKYVKSIIYPRAHQIALQIALEEQSPFAYDYIIDKLLEANLFRRALQFTKEIPQQIINELLPLHVQDACYCEIFTKWFEHDLPVAVDALNKLGNERLNRYSTIFFTLQQCVLGIEDIQVRARLIDTISDERLKNDLLLSQVTEPVADLLSLEQRILFIEKITHQDLRDNTCRVVAKDYAELLDMRATLQVIQMIQDNSVRISAVRRVADVLLDIDTKSCLGIKPMQVIFRLIRQSGLSARDQNGLRLEIHTLSQSA